MARISASLVRSLASDDFGSYCLATRAASWCRPDPTAASNSLIVHFDSAVSISPSSWSSRSVASFGHGVFASFFNLAISCRARTSQPVSFRKVAIFRRRSGSTPSAGSFRSGCVRSIARMFSGGNSRGSKAWLQRWVVDTTYIESGPRYEIIWSISS